MRTTTIVMITILLATVAAVVLLLRWLGRSRRRSRAADTADLDGIRRYASSRGLTIHQAASKHAFAASGSLEGIQVSLTTSPLTMVSNRGHTAQGPLETHLRARGLPAELKLLVARPLARRSEVEDPLRRGADRLATGDPALDARFHSYAADPHQLQHWLDPTCRQEVMGLGELREVRLADGELSISLVSPVWLGSGNDDRAFHHVRPLVRSPQTLDSAARLLARLYNRARQPA